MLAVTASDNDCNALPLRCFAPGFAKSAKGEGVGISKENSLGSPEAEENRSS